MSTKSVQRNRRRKLNEKVRKAFKTSITEWAAMEKVAKIRIAKKMTSAEIRTLANRIGAELKVRKHSKKTLSNSELVLLKAEVNSSKLQAVREINNLLGIGLREAKDMVDKVW